MTYAIAMSVAFVRLSHLFNPRIWTSSLSALSISFDCGHAQSGPRLHVVSEGDTTDQVKLLSIGSGSEVIRERCISLNV
jgi:hypothetical protein